MLKEEKMLDYFFYTIRRFEWAGRDRCSIGLDDAADRFLGRSIIGPGGKGMWRAEAE